MLFAHLPTGKPCCVAPHEVNGLTCAIHNSWQNARGKAGQELVFCSPPCCFLKASLGYSRYFTAHLVVRTCLEAYTEQHGPGLLTLSPGTEASALLSERVCKPAVISVECSCTQGTQGQPISRLL